MKHENIPAILRELRQWLDLIQEQFVQKVGVTYSVVNHRETASASPCLSS
jgi:predicted transcriptional regulator